MAWQVDKQNGGSASAWIYSKARDKEAEKKEKPARFKLAPQPARKIEKDDKKVKLKKPKKL